MKFLKIICFTFFTALLFYSCSKEYSLETPITAPGTWQFNDSTTLFTGNIDTAFIETAGTTKTLTLTGPSLDGKQLFLLHLSATDSFTVGTYKASLSQSDFQYYTYAQAKTIYQADQLTGEFIVNITSIGNSKIAGTFSGAVEDSTGKIKQITKGLFSSVINLSGNSTGSGGTTTATGTLGASAGVCTSTSLSGVYAQGVALTVSNTAQITVNVTTAGTYSISTNNVNGVFFSATGTFTTTGVQNVILVGSGTPTASGSPNFTVTFGSSTCTYPVTFSAASSGTLGGSPGTCTSASPSGTYTQGVALTSANTLQVQVNVTTIGAYSISTNTVNGVTFTKSGTFTTTGVQSVILNGSGTPTGSGVQNFIITFGSSTCNFSLTFVAPAIAVGTLGGSPGTCTPVTPAGTYTQGVALNSSNTITIQVNITTAGIYNITTNTVNGVQFSGTGFVSAGVQTLVLTGSGTSTSAGIQNFTVTFGSSTCNFSITFGTVATPTSIFHCKIDGTLNNFITTAYNFTPHAELSDPFLGTPYLGLYGYDVSPTGSGLPEFSMTITNTNGTAVKTGTYDENHYVVFSGGYAIEGYYKMINADNSTTTWKAGSIFYPSASPFTIVVTSITSTRIKGTFSGKLTSNGEVSSTYKSITEGVFDLPIQ